ncbi:ATP-dependent protease ATPase subunit HslU [Rickettsiales endosymbiont of Peranema trichophorum]|uniref:ATP-dependent protease ATPase subunit HslU n=1 Tax=Rickettsiales endosymbiont of Peranema trichophorum TaxID=2486577 RepID=UPI0010234172|nr:ATP-dependent protease ATPase subunit HslU [Rickettsiales endosymbiont of Peranema trichophorum]RZI47593.1 ATP-dependent protease ATPase subunit HslU [Rickettsiales endosymbiont of Peranema trichophorum]
MQSLTPKQIVESLDRFIVGQNQAKCAVATALRNRWRRKYVPEDIRNEIVPHNILMIGPTGVGKTEIARRLAGLANAPFVKVEATKFTEVGYVGRDVDSIIRDLVDTAIALVKEKRLKEIQQKAAEAATIRLVNAIAGEGAAPETKQRFFEQFKEGLLDTKEVEVRIHDTASGTFPTIDIQGGPQMGIFNLNDLLSKALGGPKMKTVTLKVKEAYKILLKEESEKLVDESAVIKEAIELAENDGIVFIDEIDKICSRGVQGTRADISRDGVQRDLLPLLEGGSVSTKHGTIKTTHILFIASGAFHTAKPSDLLPELQGRLPVRVELSPLSEDDMLRILKEPQYSLPKQYVALLAVENVELKFTEDGLKEIAKIATNMNKDVEDIGARRLRTIIEKMLESINFTAPDIAPIKVVVNRKYVASHIASLTLTNDLNKFIL